MKQILIFLLTFSFFMVGCNSSINHKKEVELKILKIDDSIVEHKDSLMLNGNEGNWYFKKKLFNGYAVKYYPNGALKEKTGFFNGKKQGVYKVWYNNGFLKSETYYSQNTIHGSYKVWWINGTKSLESSFVKGKKEGKEFQWYIDGAMSKERNLRNGREEGLQKAWLKNGKIYVNYEAKNGRVFGMKRANLCYQLKNEKIAENK